MHLRHVLEVGTSLPLVHSIRMLYKIIVFSVDHPETTVLTEYSKYLGHTAKINLKWNPSNWSFTLWIDISCEHLKARKPSVYHTWQLAKNPFVNFSSKHHMKSKVAMAVTRPLIQLIVYRLSKGLSRFNPYKVN